MTEKYRNRAMRGRQSKRRRGRRGGEIITKGSCKGEDRQILSKGETLGIVGGFKADDKDSFISLYSR